MAVQNTSNLESESQFCGSTELWNDEVLSGDAPAFTPCFQDTVLVYIPFGWLFVSLPFYLRYLLKLPPGFSLPLTAFSIFKSILSVILLILVIIEIWAHDTYGYLCQSDDVTTSYYVGAAIRIIFYVIAAVGIQYIRIKHIYSSGILYTFWFLLLVSTVIPLQWKISFQPSCPSSFVYYVYFAVIVIQFVLHSFADKERKIGYQDLGRKVQCPESQSSTLNKLTFWWLSSVVIKAYKRTIGVTDLWEQTPDLQSDTCIPVLEEQWQKEIECCKRGPARAQSIVYKRRSIINGKQNAAKTTEEEPLLSSKEYTKFYSKVETNKMPSLYKTLIRTYWKTWIFACLLKIIDDIFALGQPFLLKYIIDLIENKDPNEPPDWTGFILAILFFLSGMGTTVFFSQAGFQMMRLGLHVKTSVIGLIYRKALTMSNASKKNYTVGDIVNLMSVDCQRIQNGFQLQYEVVSFFVMVSLGLYLVWIEMGIATLGCLAAILLVAGLNIWLGKIQQKIQTVILKMKSSRIRLLKEVLNGIKVLKMYTWEPSFTSKLLGIRGGEMKYLGKFANVTSVAVLLSAHSPFFMTFSILLIYVSMSGSSYLSAAKIFTALSTVNILRFSLSLVPYLIAGVTQLIVSLGRIQAFLWKEDIDLDNVSNSMNSEHAVSIENGTFTWDRDDPNITLKDIEMKIPDGKLVAVVGQVGSGKSSLISAILGELEKLSGEVNVKGSVAYVPQEAWIQNLTVKDNILFGEKYSKRKYEKVIKACALLPDLAILSAGDQTEIGEKGINVSGGQKQRISLARAVYNNCDIYLLDDPLSAVDSHVGKDLFKNVIGHTGLLKNKTRILVTHGVHWLPNVDAIILMENGRIREAGTYDDLLNRKGVFAQFLQTYLLQDNPEEEDEDQEISKLKDQMWIQVENVLSDYEGISAEESLSRRKSIKEASRSLSTSTKQEKHQKNIEKPENEPASNSKRLMTPSLQRQISENLTESVTRNVVMEDMTDGRHFPFNDDVDDETTKAAGSLITEETTKIGSVKFSVFVSYIKAMRPIGFFISVLSLACFHAFNAYGNFYLTFWTEDELLLNESLSYTAEYKNRNVYYLTVYGILGMVQACFVLLFGLIGLHCLVRASGIYHSDMLHCVMRSPMSFFDTTPIGRIMNRFSSDIDILDDRLPFSYRWFLHMFFSMVAILVVICITTPIFIVAILPVGVLYVLILRFYLPTARQLKRIESVTRSPIYNHFSETISGANIIRAYKADARFKDVSNSRVDKNSSFFFAAITGSWWIGYRLEFLGNILILAAALFSLLQTGINGADVGLSLTYSMQIIYALNFVIQAVSELEMNIVSAERVEEYTVLKPEAEWIIPSRRPLSTWPQTGKVEFKDYTTRYRPGLDLVLRGINCSIQDGEKIGIVGRTGAGKSSMTLSLFRLIEAAGGGIDIDNLRISEIGLHDLRSKITILPQDPVLFSGSLKQNLDPLEIFTDSDMWQALERAHLKAYIMTQPAHLNMECGEGGSNFSVGQRQLVCLARTLLHKTKVLILDEATAAVDIETDELIQETIRTEFSECTVLTIAHRLNTVMDYDRIMVLDKGLIVEFNSPKELLGNKEGVFYKMAKDANLVN